MTSCRETENRCSSSKCRHSLWSHNSFTGKWIHFCCPQLTAGAGRQDEDVEMFQSFIDISADGGECEEHLRKRTRPQKTWSSSSPSSPLWCKWKKKSRVEMRLITSHNWIHSNNLDTWRQFTWRGLSLCCFRRRSEIPTPTVGSKTVLSNPADKSKGDENKVHLTLILIYFSRHILVWSNEFIQNIFYFRITFYCIFSLF